MIPLRKFDGTHHLHGNAIRWLARRADLCRDARARAEDVSRYRHDYSRSHVKHALLDETHCKCAYCESKYGTVSFGDIDHIRPCANAPDLILDYANLTIACQKCNNRKGAYDDPIAALLDPYSEDPVQRLIAWGALIIPRPGTDADKRALNTIEVFQLNLRAELTENRQSVAKRALQLADDYLSARIETLRRRVEREIVAMCQPAAEYALVARTIFAIHLPDFPLPALK